MSQRTERVDELLRQEIGGIMTREVADPRVGFATITQVETTRDLRHAKVWVSVIGQPAERDATMAALRHAVPFIRHELGRTLRIKRIPDLHLQLDDTAERGTRLLHLLERDRSRGHARRRRPGRGIAADTDRARASARRSRRGAAVRGPQAGSERQASVPGRRAIEWRPPDQARVVAVTVDLGAYLDAVPDVVVERIRGARRVLAVSHENPDADTIGATLGVSHLVAAHGGVTDPVCTDPVPPVYDFVPGVERFRTDPDPDAPYDLLVISDCGSLERVGAVATRHADLFARLPRVVIDHHASNQAADAADWIDPNAAATCEMVTLLAARLGVPLDAADGALADGPDGRHRHGHRDLRPSECDAAHADASPRPSSRPARRCPTSRGGCIAPSPTRSCGSSVASWIGSRAPMTAGSCGAA